MVIKRSTVEKIPRGSLMNNLMSENPDDFFGGKDISRTLLKVSQTL